MIHDDFLRGKKSLTQKGGPLIRQNGGELVGITAFGCSRFQRVAFSKISYFFDWISHKTGLNLPKCHQKATF